MNEISVSSQKKKKKNFWVPGHFGRLQNIVASLVLKKYILFLFLFLLVNDSVLIYLETTILYIYNFLILYEHLFGVFFILYTMAS